MASEVKDVFDAKDNKDNKELISNEEALCCESENTSTPSKEPTITDSQKLVKQEKSSESEVGKKETESNKEKVTASKPEKKKQNKKDNYDAQDFKSEGIQFKAKFIGLEPVLAHRGNDICHTSMALLKAEVTASRQHKKRIIITLKWESVCVHDEATKELLFELPLTNISFVWKDPLDKRALGIICLEPVVDNKTEDSEVDVKKNANRKFIFYAFKTEKQSFHLVHSLKTLFTLKESNDSEDESPIEEKAPDERVSSDTAKDLVNFTETSQNNQAQPLTNIENKSQVFNEEATKPSTVDTLIDIFGPISGAQVTQESKTIPANSGADLLFVQSSMSNATIQPNTMQAPSNNYELFSQQMQLNEQTQISAGSNQLRRDSKTAHLGYFPTRPPFLSSQNPFATGMQSQHHILPISNQSAPIPAVMNNFSPYFTTNPILSTSMDSGFGQQKFGVSDINPFSNVLPAQPKTSMEFKSDTMFQDLIANSGLSGANKRFPDKDDMLIEEKKPPKPSLMQMAMMKQQQGGLADLDFSLLEGGNEERK